MKRKVIVETEIDCSDVFCGPCRKVGKITNRLRDDWVLGAQHRCALFGQVCIEPQNHRLDHDEYFKRCRACLAAERKSKEGKR